MVLDESPLTLRYTLLPADGQTELPQWLQIGTFENGDLKLWGEPQSSPQNPVTIIVQVTDQEGLATSDSFSFNVQPPPTGSGINDVTAASGDGTDSSGGAGEGGNSGNNPDPTPDPNAGQ
jgi:hypothetical protein